MDIRFRMAERGDCAVILEFIRELAVYEKRADQVSATVKELEEWLFDKRVAEVLLASVNAESGVNRGAGASKTDGIFNNTGDKSGPDYKTVGFALFFPHYSTFLGLPGLYLEDIYVLTEYRGRGIGTAMMRELARIAISRGYGRFEWSCLDWNAPSIEFYLKLGAVPLDEWTTYRLTGEPLLKMAGEP